jgi:hypothetical protein
MKIVDHFDPSQPFPHVHHPTCQRQYKTKGIITPLVNKGLLVLLYNSKDDFLFELNSCSTTTTTTIE